VSSGVVLAVARVLTAWLDERKNRTVKLNGKELRGYSAKRGREYSSCQQNHVQEEPKMNSDEACRALSKMFLNTKMETSQ